MPKISLVVCLYRERDFLERLLQKSRGCYDDLVVVHDGVEKETAEKKLETDGVAYEQGWKSPEELSLKEPDAPPVELARDYADLRPKDPIPIGYRLAGGKPVPGSIHELVVKYGGRFYEGPRCFQQEPHWPFAWWAAKHDWILRLDADEYPSDELRSWLHEFSKSEAPVDPGYLGIWPLWTGDASTWRRSYPTRVFLFDKRRISYFGMAEHSPMPITNDFVPVDKVIEHRPERKSYGVANLVLRKQAFRWRGVIAASLLGMPGDLPCWRLKENQWPRHWRGMRTSPIFWGLKCGLVGPIFQAIHALRSGVEFAPDAYLGTGLHQFLMAITFLLKKRRVI